MKGGSAANSNASPNLPSEEASPTPGSPAMVNLQKRVLIRPLIFHTYEPEVVHTDRSNFMKVVQELTGLNSIKNTNVNVISASTPQYKKSVHLSRNTNCNSEPVPSAKLHSIKQHKIRKPGNNVARMLQLNAASINQEILDQTRLVNNLSSSNCSFNLTSSISACSSPLSQKSGHNNNLKVNHLLDQQPKSESINLPKPVLTSFDQQHQSIFGGRSWMNPHNPHKLQQQLEQIQQQQQQQQQHQVPVLSKYLDQQQSSLTPSLDQQLMSNLKSNAGLPTLPYQHQYLYQQNSVLSNTGHILGSNNLDPQNSALSNIGHMLGSNNLDQMNILTNAVLTSSQKNVLTISMLSSSPNNFQSKNLEHLQPSVMTNKSHAKKQSNNNNQQRHLHGTCLMSAFPGQQGINLQTNFPLSNKLDRQESLQSTNVKTSLDARLDQNQQNHLQTRLESNQHCVQATLQSANLDKQNHLKTRLESRQQLVQTTLLSSYLDQQNHIQSSLKSSQQLVQTSPRSNKLDQQNQRFTSLESSRQILQTTLQSKNLDQQHLLQTSLQSSLDQLQPILTTSPQHQSILTRPDLTSPQQSNLSNLSSSSSNHESRCHNQDKELVITASPSYQVTATAEPPHLQQNIADSALSPSSSSSSSTCYENDNSSPASAQINDKNSNIPNPHIHFHDIFDHKNSPTSVLSSALINSEENNANNISASVSIIFPEIHHEFLHHDVSDKLQHPFFSFESHSSVVSRSCDNFDFPSSAGGPDPADLYPDLSSFPEFN